MKELQLSKGGVALVDDGDYEFLNQWKWHKNKLGYVVRFTTKGEYTSYACRSAVLLHRAIMGNPPKQIVDHIDGNRLLNIRKNLRVCSNTENVRNQRKHLGY